VKCAALGHAHYFLRIRGPKASGKLNVLNTVPYPAPLQISFSLHNALSLPAGLSAGIIYVNRSA